MLTDIGGGMGHKAVAVKKRFPDLPGRFIVQDLPQIIEGQKLDACMDSIAHDFFTPQPLEGTHDPILSLLTQKKGAAKLTSPTI